MGEAMKSISDATELLAERRKLEAWLAALDERRDATSAHVFSRVRADYESRLESVVADLASNADALDARLQELAGRADTLDADARAIQDERAEAELRSHVGELDPEAWERVARDADERLQRLGEDRRTLDEELGSIRELLTAARTPTPAAAAAAVEPPAPAEDGAAGTPTPEEPSPAVDAAAGDEAAAGGDAPLVSDSAAEKPSDAFDELAFLRDVTGAPATPAASTARPVDDTLGLVLPNDAPAIVPPRRASTETPMAANVPGNSPIVIKPEPSRQGKTLKCTECGSMNYPTEWYCERCGAELSAL